MNLPADGAAAMSGRDKIASRWRELLVELNAVFAAPSSAFAIHYSSENRGRLVYPVGIREPFLTSYEQFYGSLNPWFCGREGADTHNSAWVETPWPAELSSTRARFFREWLEPQGLQHALVGMIGRHEQTQISLLILRRIGDNRFDSDDAAKLETSLPLVSQVWDLERQARAANSNAEATWGVLDQSRAAVILVRRDGRIAGVSKKARALIERGRVLRVRNQRLCLAYASNQKRLRETLDGLFSGVSGANKQTSKGFHIRRPGSRTKVYLIASRVGHPENGHGDGQPLVALYLFDPEEQIDLRVELLEDLYGLTQLESRISLAVCEGLSLAAVAERLHVSIHTVRSYMKEIFQKVGVHRQSELISRLLRGPGLLDGGGEFPAGPRSGEATGPAVRTSKK